MKTKKMIFYLISKATTAAEIENATDPENSTFNK